METVMGGRRLALAMASNRLIDEVSSAMLEQFLATRKPVLQ
jgi:hypothetical protein